MVAIGDFGIREREQMVRLAIWYGWIEKAVETAKARGMTDPVVMLIAGDSLNAFPIVFDRSPRNRRMERLQREAGCKWFTVAVSSYAALLHANAAEGWRDDMEDMRRKGGTSVVCITRTGQFLAAVSPENPEQPRDAWDSLFYSPERDTQHG